MKDVFASRAVAEFWSLMQDFAESLSMACPDCRDTKDWLLWLNNVVGNDEVEREKSLQIWYDSINTPIKKGCAKYAKAVLSITGSPATVYHAVEYHDVDAVHASCENIVSLDFPAKLANMSPEQVVIFWQYFEELNKNCFKALRKDTPRVPTTQEISNDIARRKASGGKGASSSAPGSGENGGTGLHQGIGEIWRQLQVSRGVEVKPFDDTIRKRLHDASKCTVDGDSSNIPLLDAWKQHDPNALSTMLRLFPEFGCETDAFTSEQYAHVDKMFNLIVMEGSIPSGMMRGIEVMASKLVDDIACGNTDLSELNIEKIGQEVLAGVCQSDIDSFAQNVDKIMPALQNLKH